MPRWLAAVSSRRVGTPQVSLCRPPEGLAAVAPNVGRAVAGRGGLVRGLGGHHRCGAGRLDPLARASCEEQARSQSARPTGPRRDRAAPTPRRARPTGQRGEGEGPYPSAPRPARPSAPPRPGRRRARTVLRGGLARKTRPDARSGTLAPDPMLGSGVPSSRVSGPSVARSRAPRRGRPERRLVGRDANPTLPRALPAAADLRGAAVAIRAPGTGRPRRTPPRPPLGRSTGHARASTAVHAHAREPARSWADRPSAGPRTGAVTPPARTSRGRSRCGPGPARPHRGRGHPLAPGCCRSHHPHLLGGRADHAR